MKKIPSRGSIFRAILFAAILFLLPACAQQVKIPEVEYALVWQVLKDFV